MSTFLRLVLLYCLGACTSATAATFTFRFMDGPGEGFNDTTPIPLAQAGNNPGLTFGEARRNLLMEAGRIWGALLVSNVPIVVDAAFNPQDCGAMATLASAGARTYFRDFSDSFSPDTFFASALADSIAGADLMQQLMDPQAQNNPDITATFNLTVDTDPACLNGQGFYYGFDHLEGTRIDALVVALHELAHGFGFASEVNLSTGTAFVDSNGVERFSTFVMQIFDENLSRTWPMLSPAERVNSAVGNIGLAWNGINVNNSLSFLTSGISAGRRLRLFSPAPVSQGSSVSHWERTATPNLLMEPAISRDLNMSTVDLTVCALRDIGWQTTRCPDQRQARGATPVANPLAVTVMEDTITQITLTGSDAENDPLVFNVATPPTKGTVSASSVSALGMTTRTYTPGTNLTGPDSFTFTVDDGGTTSTPAIVTINITPVNDPPTAVGFSIAATSGQDANIPLVGSDVDGDSVAFEIVTPPASGTLTGTAMGSLQLYRSNMGFVGTDSFTYRVRDATTTSNTVTVTINVMAASTPSTPVPGGRGGGGGAMNEWLLLALGLLAITALKHARSRGDSVR